MELSSQGMTSYQNCASGNAYNIWLQGLALLLGISLQLSEQVQQRKRNLKTRTLR